MTDYAVIGVLQDQNPPDEWVMIAEAVQGRNEADAAYFAAVEAFKRHAQDPKAKKRSYPTSWLMPVELETKHNWNYWLIAIVEIAPGLPIVYDGQAAAFPVDALAQVLGPRPNYEPLIVGAGQWGGGDEWVQRWRSPTLTQAESEIERFARAHNIDFEGAYGFVEETSDGRFAVYDSNRKLVKRVGGASESSPLADDLKVVNRHRSHLGMDPIDMSSTPWTSREISEMANNIREHGTMTNPAQAELKRSLMR